MNPILQNRNYLYAYSIFWVLVAGAHFLFIFYILKLSFTFSLIDSIVYNLVYFPLGMAIWYVVRFNRMDSNKIFQLVTMHVIAAFLLSLVWVLFSYGLVTNIIQDIGFSQFQRSILPSRFLIGLLYYVIMCLAYYLIIYYLNLRERIRKEASINTLLKEAELNALKLQINPHFIFNSLNSVNSLILIKPELAQEMIVKLSDFLRSTLSGTSKQLVSLQEELNFSRLYLEIEKIRFGEKLNFEIEMDDQWERLTVPHMLFQPLLENAIKHGVQQSSIPVNIKMKISLEDEFLSIIIKNNFEGISNAPGKKIGLKNVNDRLSLIFNRNDLMKAEAVKNEYIVSIRIPVTSPVVHE